MYIKEWRLLPIECLFFKKETSNGDDKNGVAVIHLHCCGTKEVVGYVPQNISEVVLLYLSRCHIFTQNLKSLENA